MGIKDYLAKKKYQKKLEYVAKIMDCDEQHLMPSDLLSLQSYIFSEKNESTKHLHANTACEIETYIFTCFYIGYCCIIGIEQEKYKEICFSTIAVNYSKALSKEYKYKQDFLIDLITKRACAYEDLLQSGLNQLCEGFSQMLGYAKSTNNIKEYDSNSPKIIDGFDLDVDRKIEITSFISALDKTCNKMIEETILFFNSL